MSPRSVDDLAHELELHVAAAQAVDVVDDGHARLGVVQRAADLREQRTALGAERLGAVEHRDGLHAAQRGDEVGGRERPEHADLDDAGLHAALGAHLLAPCGARCRRSSR